MATSTLHFIDLKTLNYYCDSKGNQDQAVIYSPDPTDDLDLKEPENTKKYLFYLKEMSYKSLFLFDPASIIQLDSFFSRFSQFLTISSIILLDYIKSNNIENINIWSKFICKGLKRFRVVHNNFLKCGYKYYGISMMNIFFNESLLILLFYSQNSRLFLEILMTINTISKEELDLKKISLKENVKNLIISVFRVYFNSEKINKLLKHLFDEKEFWEIKTNFQKLGGHKSIQNECGFEKILDLSKFTKEKIENFIEITDFNDNLLDQSWNLLKNYDNLSFLCKEHIDLYLELRIRKQNNDPNERILLSLSYFHLFNFIKYYNTMYFLGETINPFAFNPYYDGFLIIFLLHQTSNPNNYVFNYILDTLLSISKENKIANYYSPKENDFINWLDSVFEEFLKGSKIFIKKIEKKPFILEKYIKILKTLKIWISYEMIPETSKANNLLIETLNFIINEYFNENLTINNFNNNYQIILSNSCIDLASIMNQNKHKIHKFSQNFILFLIDLIQNSQKLLNDYKYKAYLYFATINSIKYSSENIEIINELLFFKELLLDSSSKLWNIFNIDNFNRISVCFIHSLMNNLILSLLGKLKNEDFQTEFMKSNKFLIMFKKITFENNMAFYRGVFVHLIPLLKVLVFEAYNSLEKLEENKELYLYLQDFIDIYLKDYLLWTNNGCIDYPNFPVWIRPLFWKRFMSLVYEIKEILYKDNENLSKIYMKIINYESIDFISKYDIAFINYLAYRNRELITSIVSLKEHLCIEETIIFNKNELENYLKLTTILEIPIRSRTKSIFKSIVKECYFIENESKKSQFEIISNELSNILPVFKEKLCNFNLKFKEKTPFTQTFAVSEEFDYNKIELIIGFLFKYPKENRQDYLDNIIIISKTETMLANFDKSIKILQEADLSRYYDTINKILNDFPSNYSILLDFISDEMNLYLQLYYKSVAENPTKQKIQIFNKVINELLGNKFLRKTYRPTRIYKYFTSIIKHLTNLYYKNKNEDQIIFKISTILLEMKKSLINSINNSKIDDNWSLFSAWFFLSELFWFRNIRESELEILLDKNFINWLNELANKIGLELENENLRKIIKLNNYDNIEFIDLKDCSLAILIKFFYNIIMNEFLMGSSLEQLLNNRENLMLETNIYEQKAKGILNIIKSTAKINKLIGKADDNKPPYDLICKQYKKFFTKDPIKINNYFVFGRLAIDFFLSLIYDYKLHIRSSQIFELIYHQILSKELKFQDKCIITVFFSSIFEKQCQLIYPNFNFSLSKKINSFSKDLNPRICELSIPEPKISLNSEIFAITIQTFLLNLISRLIQNTNDNNPEIEKGIDIIFDNLESKLNFAQYCNIAFKISLENDVPDEDIYAVFDETIIRGKDFFNSIVRNIQDFNNKIKIVIQDVFCFENEICNFFKKTDLKEGICKFFREKKFFLQNFCLLLGRISCIENFEFLDFFKEKTMNLIREILSLKAIENKNTIIFANKYFFNICFLIQKIFIFENCDFLYKNIEIIIKNLFFSNDENYVTIQNFNNFLNKNICFYGLPFLILSEKLCENDSEKIYLKKEVKTNGKMENFKLSDEIKLFLTNLIENIIEDFIEFIEFEIKKSNILNKNERIELKKSNKKRIINRNLLITILTKLLENFPLLIPLVLEIDLKSEKIKNFTDNLNLTQYKIIDLLIIFYPYSQNTIYQLFNVFFTKNYTFSYENKEENSTNFLFNKITRISLKVLNDLLEKISMYNEKEEKNENIDIKWVFLSTNCIERLFFELNGVFNLNYLLLKSKNNEFFAQEILTQSLKLLDILTVNQILLLNESKTLFILIKASWKLLIKNTIEKEMKIKWSKEIRILLGKYLEENYSNSNDFDLIPPERPNNLKENLDFDSKLQENSELLKGDITLNVDEFNDLNSSIPKFSTKASLNMIFPNEEFMFSNQTLKAAKKSTQKISLRFLSAIIKRSELQIPIQFEQFDLKSFRDRNIFVSDSINEKNEILNQITNVFQNEQLHLSRKPSEKPLSDKQSAGLGLDPFLKPQIVDNSGFPYELYDFPKNALSLYGIDPEFFQELGENERIAVLTEAKHNYIELIQPELIQYLYDFKGNGFPDDALTLYGIDPYYFADLDELSKKEILDYAKSGYLENVRKLEEKEKVTNYQNCLVSKLKVFELLERNAFEENDEWNVINKEIENMEGFELQNNLLKRLDKQKLEKINKKYKINAAKARKEFLQIENNEIEEKKENLEKKQENLKERNNFDLLNEMKLLLKIPIEEEKKIDLSSEQHDFNERAEKFDILSKLPKIPSKTIYKLLMISEEIALKPIRINFLKLLKSFCIIPSFTPNFIDGLFFILQRRLQDEKLQIPPVKSFIFEILNNLLSRNYHLAIIFQSNHSLKNGLNFLNINFQLENLKKTRENLINTEEKNIFFLALSFLDEKHETLPDFIQIIVDKILISDSLNLNKVNTNKIIVKLDKKQLFSLFKDPSGSFFNPDFIESFIKLLINEPEDALDIINMLLMNFRDIYEEILSQIPFNLVDFNKTHKIISLKTVEPIEKRQKLLLHFYDNILVHYESLSSLSRTLKLISNRFSLVFKKRFCENNFEKFLLNRGSAQFWLKEHEKQEFSIYLNKIREVVETKENLHFFTNVIEALRALIDNLGDDFVKTKVLEKCYNSIKPGLKAFIYVFSLVNPVEEVNIDNDELIDNDENPQLSKYLSLDEESVEKHTEFALDKVLKLVDSHFCGVCDFFIRSCSAGHNNNKLSYVWRYLIQTKTDFAKISADTKFILIKNIAKEKAKLISSEHNTRQIRIKRDSIWNSTMEKLLTMKPSELALDDFKIEFEDEEGIDAGGLKREWLSLLPKEIFNPDFGLFQPSANQISYQPSCLSHIVPDHLIHFRMIGRLIAKCLIENWTLGVYFPKSFLKHILKKNLNLKDLEDIDGDLARGLEWVINNPVNELYSNFTYERKEFDVVKVYELKPGGGQESVTEENKREFVKLFAITKMGLEIQQQAQAMISGIHEIIPVKAISLLDEKELGLKIAGMPEINIEQMKQYAVFLNNYDNDIPQWLWEILTEYDEKMRAQFLFFTSGSFRVPSEGFQKLPLKIQKISNKNCLPVAHTCFNQIDLPQYDSKEILKEKLNLAITEGGEGFYIV